MLTICTLKVIRLETQKSKVKWEGVDWEEMTKYIAMNITEYRARTLRVSHLLPKRKYNMGRPPGITSDNAMNRDKDHEVRWISVLRGRELTREEQPLMMGVALEITVCHRQEKTINVKEIISTYDFLLLLHIPFQDLPTLFWI